MMKPPESPFASGRKVGLGANLGSEALDGALGRESAAQIAVPRVVRPTPRAPAPLAVSARLLEVATEHLRRLGPKRVTLMAVAADAGTTHPNVYRYFASRNALVDAVVERWLRDMEVELTRIADAPDPSEDKIEHLLTALASIQRETLIHEPNLFAVHLDATVRKRLVAKRHRVRLRSLVERVVEEGITLGAFVTRDREQAIAYIFDASYRFTHPLPIQQDADLPHDLVEARFATVILAIQTVLRTGTI